jgi:perosamine synthetase
MIKPNVKYELEAAFGNIYGNEEAAALNEVLKNNAPSCGKMVKQFEEEFARYCGVPYALAVTNATSGLMLAGIAAGIKPGDEVITTPTTWVSTAMAFSTLGAKMVFCDVDARTLNLDAKKLEAKITPRTKVIVPVHLYGQCCEMDAIMRVAEKHNLIVVEDCAHNPGGEYNGRKSGSLGHIGVFSFHQQKNMSTLGEGGMVTTSSKEFYERVLSFRSLCCRSYDPKGKYLPVDENKYPMNDEYWRLFFDDFGYNFRMTDAQGAVGLEQLKKLDGFNARRINIATLLNEKLQGIRGLTLPYVDPRGKHVFHLYVIQLESEFPLGKRDFMWTLYSEMGIKPWSNYMPVHLTDPYKREGHQEGECPVAEEAYKKYVSLPIHPRMTDEAVDYLADSVRKLSTN